MCYLPKLERLSFTRLGWVFLICTCPPKGANEVQHVEFMKTQNAIYEFDRIDNLHEFLQDRKHLIELSNNAFASNYKLDGSHELVRFLLESADR